MLQFRNFRNNAMESGNHFKNGVSLRSKTSRKNFLLFGMILLVFCAFTNKANAQFSGTGNGTSSNPWHIGCGTTNTSSAVTAYISGTTLYINGTGNMADFWFSGAPINGQAPWYWSESQRNNIRTVVIGNNVTNIGDKAFEKCVGLTTIQSWGNVKRIGKKAFEGCTSLQTISIPNIIDEIEGEAFLNCNNLRTVTIENGYIKLRFSIFLDNYHIWKSDWFLNCPIQTLHFGREYHTLSLIEYDKLFHKISTLKTVIIGNTINTLDVYTFTACLNLEDVRFEDGTSALSFSSTVFPSNTIKNLYMGRQIITTNFHDNTSLKSLIIGDKVTSIFATLFWGCRGLTQITSNSSTPPTIHQDTFYGAGKNIPVEVPCNSICNYKSAQDWKDFTNYQSIENSCNSTCATSIEEVSIQKFQIYPNLVSESFRINGIVENALISIIDITGKTVLQQTIIPDETVAVGHLPAGIYFVNIKGKTMKMIKR